MSHTHVAATVAGHHVRVADVDLRESRLRDAVPAAALPRAGTSEGRQLCRWLTQLMVTERVIARDPTRLAALLAGQVDAIDAVPIADLERLRKENRFGLFRGAADFTEADALTSETTNTEGAIQGYFSRFYGFQLPSVNDGRNNVWSMRPGSSKLAAPMLGNRSNCNEKK